MNKKYQKANKLEKKSKKKLTQKRSRSKFVFGVSEK